MRIKQLIKCLLPPLLTDLLRKLRPPTPLTSPTFTWEGVYKHRRDVPIEGGDYDDDRRIDYLVLDVRRVLETVDKDNFSGYARHTVLGLLASVLSNGKKGIRILDFGGGAGTGFVQLLGLLRNKSAIQYHVVEFERTCKAGRQLFVDDSRIQFHTSVPEFPNGLDIAYVCGVLCYFDDYAKLLQSLAALNPPYLLLGDLAAGDFPTYAARQLNLPGQVLAYWFLNLDEVIRNVEACGYTCIYSGKFGKEYDQSNFPETHRVGQMCSLLFSRNVEPSTKCDQR